MKKLLLLSCLLCGSAFGDVSVYEGFLTAHLFTGSAGLNNNNSVTIVKVDNVMFGGMVNSYGEVGGLLGYQHRAYRRGRVEVFAGLTLVSGYRRWQLPHFKTAAAGSENDKVLVLLPLVSASFYLTDTVSVQGNLMAGVVFNVGIRKDF
jgi:hypothetical protein